MPKGALGQFDLLKHEAFRREAMTSCHVQVAAQRRYEALGVPNAEKNATLVAMAS